MGVAFTDGGGASTDWGASIGGKEVHPLVWVHQSGVHPKGMGASRVVHLGGAFEEVASRGASPGGCIHGERVPLGVHPEGTSRYTDVSKLLHSPKNSRGL